MSEERRSQRVLYSATALARAANPGPKRASSLQLPYSIPPTRSAPPLMARRFASTHSGSGIASASVVRMNPGQRSRYGQARDPLPAAVPIRHARVREENRHRSVQEQGQGTHGQLIGRPLWSVAAVVDYDNYAEGHQRSCLPCLSGKGAKKERKPLLLVLGGHGYNGMGMAHFITHANRTTSRAAEFGSPPSVSGASPGVRRNAQTSLAPS
jgi:hypothetical protein